MEIHQDQNGLPRKNKWIQMKTLFPGHFKESEENLKKIWENCLFVFERIRLVLMRYDVLINIMLSIYANYCYFIFINKFSWINIII